MPWQFVAKLAAVLLLTVTKGYIHWLERLVPKGDPGTPGRIGIAGKVAEAFAVLAVVFAVMTFQ